MIEFVKGDFFDFDADIRVNTVNCAGVMGAGVALNFKNRFPRMFDEYVKVCELNLIRPGKPHVWEQDSMFGKPLTIINFPTKDHWRNPSEYKYIEDGLIWLKGFLASKDKSTVTLPALGCGHGGLNWVEVKELIKKYLANLSARILVFEPQSSEFSLSKEELESQGIIRIETKNLFAKLFHSKLPDAIFFRGKESLLYNKTLSVIIDSKAGEKEIDSIVRCIEQFRDIKITLLLGFANRVEIDLVKELLKFKIDTILVLSHGISQLKVRKDLREIWEKNVPSLISVGGASSKWSVGESIQALRFRIFSSNLILIGSLNFEAWAKFEKDFKESKNPIFFINYWDSKVDFFEKINAKQIGKKRETLKPNINPILQVL